MKKYIAVLCVLSCFSCQSVFLTLVNNTHLAWRFGAQVIRPQQQMQIQVADQTFLYNVPVGGGFRSMWKVDLVGNMVVCEYRVLSPVNYTWITKSTRRLPITNDTVLLSLAPQSTDEPYAGPIPY